MDAGSECACCGARTLEFRRGNELVVSLSVHHGTRLRWTDGPTGEAVVGAELTPEASASLGRWMDDNAAGSSALMFVSGLGELVPEPAGADASLEVGMLPTVIVTPEGFEARLVGGSLPPACQDPHGGASPHDLAWLRGCAEVMGRLEPRARAAVVVASDVPYGLVVGALEETRGPPERPNFPRVGLALDAWRVRSEVEPGGAPRAPR